MTTNKLMSCPFCGGEARTVRNEGEWTVSFTTRCMDCNASRHPTVKNGLDYSLTAALSQEAWNTRVNPNKDREYIYHQDAINGAIHVGLKRVLDDFKAIVLGMDGQQPKTSED